MIRNYLAAALLLVGATPASAQITTYIGPDRKPQTVDAAHPLPVTSASGGGTAGGATAANQTTQITAEQDTRDRLGATSAPAAGTVNAQLGAIRTALGTPAQAGGPVSITGAVPLPTGAATAARQDAMLTALGTPLQAGGSVSVAGTVATALDGITDGAATPFSVAAPVTAGGNVVASTNVTGYSSLFLYLTSIQTSGATLTLQQSYDNTNWISVFGQNPNTNNSLGSTQTVGTFAPYFYQIQAPYIRIIQNGTGTAGTTTGTIVLKRQAYAPQTYGQTTAIITAAGANIKMDATAGTGFPASTAFQLLSAATTNATVVKASAGKLVYGSIANLSAAVKFVRFYATAAVPVPGTTAQVRVVAVPPNTTIGIPSVLGAFGMYFSTGIAISITGGAATADTTPVAAGDVLVDLGYL
jgi:hypothetical protein